MQHGTDEELEQDQAAQEDKAVENEAGLGLRPDLRHPEAPPADDAWAREVVLVGWWWWR